MKRKTLLQSFRARRKGPNKKIVITAEKSETYVIRQQPKGSLHVWCDGCDQEIECLTIDQAVTLTGLSARRLFHLIEEGEIHFSEMGDGQLLVCPNSIAFLNGFYIKIQKISNEGEDQ